VIEVLMLTNIPDAPKSSLIIGILLDKTTVRLVKCAGTIFGLEILGNISSPDCPESFPINPAGVENMASILYKQAYINGLLIPKAPRETSEATGSAAPETIEHGLG